MEIKYLKEVLTNPISSKWNNEGFSIEKIEQLEAKYNKGNKFPQALREHLFLAGAYNNYGFDTVGGVEELQETLKEEIEWCGFKMKRPMFAYEVRDSMYLVAMLDETNEDPLVYVVCPFLAKAGSEPLIKPNGLRFSEVVNGCIKRIKMGLSAF
jgi:hypothetical protein